MKLLFPSVCVCLIAAVRLGQTLGPNSIILMNERVACVRQGLRALSPEPWAWVSATPGHARPRLLYFTTLRNRPMLPAALLYRSSLITMANHTTTTVLVLEALLRTIKMYRWVLRTKSDLLGVRHNNVRSPAAGALLFVFCFFFKVMLPTFVDKPSGDRYFVLRTHRYDITTRRSCMWPGSYALWPFA